MRSTKTYNGQLMSIGKANENAVLAWLQSYSAAKEILDFREFRIAQRIDVDFAIETLDGTMVLAEVKADKHICQGGNLLFEQHRINHFVRDKWFYLGWGWRSPAQKLIVRNYTSGETFVFCFLSLREFVAAYIGRMGGRLRQVIVETDDQKTTFSLLVPFSDLPKDLYKRYLVPD